MKKTDGESSPSELGVGEVAKRSGVTVSTLHFYDRWSMISYRDGVTGLTGYGHCSA